MESLAAIRVTSLGAGEHLATPATAWLFRTTRLSGLSEPRVPDLSSSALSKVGDSLQDNRRHECSSEGE